MAEIGKQSDRAARMAGSSALRAMRAEASRQIRERKAIKVAMLTRALKMEFPSDSGTRYVWTLSASSAPMPVAAYSHRQTRLGVSVEINVGRRVLIKHAFVARMRSGHVGVFYRLGKARLPIDEAYTTRISDVFKDVAPVVATRGEQIFRESFQRIMRTSP